MTGPLSTAEADARIGRHLGCLPIESLPLTQCAGAILRENVYAERDAPPFDRVTMDGYAIAVPGDGRLAATTWRVQGVQPAGAIPLTLAGERECIEIMTGAVLPAGCDGVIPVEAVSVRDGGISLDAHYRGDPRSNVHRRGSDSRQGALLLSMGQRLGAPEVAVAASAGMARLRVSAQPRIVVISTGDELVEPGEPIAAHQVRRSNAYGVQACLREHGFDRIADDHLPDEPGVLADRLRTHLHTHDVMILSGGVSMGRFDLVPKALESLGVRSVFHRVAQRPGKPLWFGITEEGRLVFGLPGNPVSTLVCLVRYVLPALARAMAARELPDERLALSAPVPGLDGLTNFLPVRVDVDDWGRHWAVPHPTRGSGDFISLAGTAGFVELPPSRDSFPKGHLARLFRWSAR